MYKVQNEFHHLLEYIEKENIDYLNKLFKESKEITLNFCNIKELNLLIYLNKIGFLEIDFIDSIERNFYDLSQGERTYFTIELLIINKIINSKEKNLLFLLDEVDNSFHPRWQKRLTNILINLVKNFNHINFSFVITSHSPFILSDLPRKNVIFLKDGKQVDVDINPFGANIHTLLSHGFFMKDGLMGEFAKNKIRIITVTHKYIIHKHKKKYLHHTNYDKTKTLIKENLYKFWEIQKIVGEPFLQTILKNQIQEIELILLKKEDAIDNEIKRLKKLKKSLYL